MGKKISKRDVCLSVPDRWAEQYATTTNQRQKEITEALNALPVAALTPERICKIIGNDSWTKLECAECGADKDYVFELEKQTICERCINKLGFY